MSGLPPYTGDKARCMKCGYTQAGTTYRPRGHCIGDTDDDQLLVLGQDSNERLCRNCFRCNHHWCEAIIGPEAGDGTPVLHLRDAAGDVIDAF